MQKQLIIPILLILLIVSHIPAQPVYANPRCFPDIPQITHCIDDRFVAYWDQQGGLPIFGYPLSPAYDEHTDVGLRTVQLFERARLEYHPDNPPPFTILLSHLGRQRGPTPTPPEQQRTGCLFFAQTGQNICDPFLTTWHSYGLELGLPGISEAESVALFGLPLTPARPETLSNGHTYTVQWFERARFEDHGPDGILLGLLGREASGLTTNTPAPVPTEWTNPNPPQQPGGFLRIAASNITLNDQPIRLKGVNYYPQWRPWSEMWTKWHAPQIEHELRQARDQLGVNAVRILLPYGVYDDGNVTNELIQRLRQICQIAGSLDMRLIVTLFDFYNTFPDAGTKTEQENIDYLTKLVGNFIGDERIFAWDLHNEPDHYEKWTQGDDDNVLDWLGRMADIIHTIDPDHMVTVGMANYQNLLIPGPDGRRVIDYSDIVSVHIYNAADVTRQLDIIISQTPKPIILQEFGWPSGPPCAHPDYTESNQAQVYRQTLAAADNRVAGIFAWTLRDYDAGPTMRWDSREEHYGLFRPDDTLKPAALEFRSWSASSLPSLTKTDLTLTTGRSINLKGERAPLLIEESGYYIKSWYRRAWEDLGSRGSLGIPLSEAFIRPEDGKVVQYFEAAVLIYEDDAFDDPGFDHLPRTEQIMRVIIPDTLGYHATHGRTFAPPENTPLPNARYFPTTGYNLTGEFWSLYENLLGPWRFGPAISSQVTEEINGIPYATQYFERGRIERDPLTGAVQPSQLGTWAWAQRCASMGQTPP